MPRAFEAGIPARNAPVFRGKYFRAGPPVLAGKRLRRAPIVSESRQYLGDRAFEACFQFASTSGRFLLHWSPVCHLQFSWCSVMAGVVVIAEWKHGTLEKHT